ncbi:YSIRK-type signal peptide-containing protein [Lactobacillus crispatus]|uniref:mucin-binding protein n=1 Tax=Lactobacillus crispatus TaxID=47770 RepID=UPI00130330ED|nr:YSIRK-type signal peptide-containing protein [Lactobacillus crispatus]QGY93997.1 YSIRK-type signal peptide-containing protein [Lactobacillus crispatus]
MLERIPKYTLRKLSVGLASVMIGSGILMNSPKVLADTTNSNEGTSELSTQSGVQNTDSKAAVQKSNNSFAEPGATNPRDTTQDKDKQTNANETKQNTTDVGKKDIEVTPTNDATTPATPKTTAAPAARTAMKAAARPNTTAKFKVLAALPKMKAAPTTETPDPTVPDNSVNTAIINNPKNLANDWMQLKQGKLKLYLTVRGLDNKTYVSSYADAQKKIKSMIISNRLDPDSLEIHVDFENNDVKKNNAIWLGWDKSVMQIDTSRLGTDGIVAYGKSGKKYQIDLNHDGGGYDSYEKMVEWGKDISQVGALYMRDPIEANDTISTTIPVKYIGNKEQTTSISLTSYFNGSKSYPGLDLDFRELHAAQIETPAKPTTDKDTVTTGIYNNPQRTTSDWIKMTHGDAIGYYTAKGKDGKTYVTGYVAANGNSQSIFNVDQIDLNSLEYHLIYHNGDKEVGSGLWFNFADNKTIAIDTSRLGADGPQLKSQQGWSYKWAINGPKDGGNYYNSWAEYLKAHNNVGDQATNISMTGVAIKPDDMVEFVIPVKYTGQLSARTPSLTFSPHINDYGKGFTQNWADLYFTTVKKDLSEVKRVVLLPTEFMGEKTGESDWKLVKEISKDMPNGWDAFKISNFPTYKGSFNMDSLPIGDKPSLVYGSAQYFIDLSKIQEIFANHGYTVKYANNNGKAQEMPFYAYSTIPLAKRVDDDKPFNNDPSIWVIQVQAVPAIILNKDQHYVADPNAKPWDTTSMIDEIYAADDAGQRKTRDQLGKLPKTDVDISYEYQAPGAATAAAVDKVDLTKAGVYTVTYSHTYADGRVVKDSRKVYVDGVKPENKKITRTIIVHEPNGTDQTVIQTATLTREVILDATTGEIKSLGEWSTAKWGTYSAPEFKGYTPDKAQIDETAVNKDTRDTTVEISYTANEITKQETKDITRTIIVHEPNGTDQTVSQKATLTREVILYAPTGEIKSVGEWSTAKWGTYSAPEFKGYTPDKAQIDETAVNKDTRDTTVEISYTANEITKQETKDITRTIIVHEPNGTDQTVSQKATLTREVILYAPTGEIKSAGKWSTAKWEAYSAPEFKGYTPAPAQIDETTVNEDTQNTTVEISYTANETSEQPGHSKDNSNNDNNGGNSGVIVPINPSANNSNNSNTAPTDNNTDTSKPTRTDRTDDISPKANVMNMTKRTTKSGTISPKAGALANTTAGPATSAKANMENGIAKNNSQNSQTLPQTGENESKVAFAVAGLLAAALGIFGIAINRKKEN